MFSEWSEMDRWWRYAPFISYRNRWCDIEGNIFAVREKAVFWKHGRWNASVRRLRSTAHMWTRLEQQCNLIAFPYILNAEIALLLRAERWKHRAAAKQQKLAEENSSTGMLVRQIICHKCALMHHHAPEPEVKVLWQNSLAGRRLQAVCESSLVHYRDERFLSNTIKNFYFKP